MAGDEIYFEGGYIETGSPVSPSTEIYPQTRPEYKKYNFVPELNFWVGNMIENCSPVAQEFLKIPVPVSEEEWRKDGTVLDLLFNYTFDFPTYSICYEKQSPKDTTDKNILKRHSIYAGRMDMWVGEPMYPVDSTSYPSDTTQFGMSVEIIECDPRPTYIPCNCGGDVFYIKSDSTPVTMDNIFDITYGEKDMLDLLLAFKNGEYVDLSVVEFDDLPSSLSKLIYIYLDFQINDRFILYDSNNPITSDNRLIEWLYEKWVIDCIYREIKFMPSLVFNSCDSSFEECGRQWQLIKLDEDNINNKRILFPEDSIPISENDIYIILDAHKQKLKDDYAYVTSSDSSSIYAAVVWSDLGMEDKVNVNDPVYLLWTHKMVE